MRRMQVLMYLLILQDFIPEIFKEDLQVLLLKIPLFQCCRQNTLPVFNDSVCA